MRCYAYIFELFENEQINARHWVFQQLLKHWVPQATANIHAACLGDKVGLRLLIFFFNVHPSASRWRPAVWMSVSVRTYYLYHIATFKSSDKHLAWLVVGCCKSRPSLYAHYASCSRPSEVGNGPASSFCQSLCQSLQLRDENMKRHYPSGREKRE